MRPWNAAGSEVAACPLVKADGTGVELIGITHDISERRRYEQELKQARAAGQAARAGGLTLPAGVAALDRQLAALIVASAPWRTPAAVADAGPVTADRPDPNRLQAQLAALRADLRGHNLQALHRFEELAPALRDALGGPALEALGRAIQGMRFKEALLTLEQSPFGDEDRWATEETVPCFVTCRALQRDHPDIPAIFVTAASDFENEIRALEAGVSGSAVEPSAR